MEWNDVMTGWGDFSARAQFAKHGFLEISGPFRPDSMLSHSEASAGKHKPSQRNCKLNSITSHRIPKTLYHIPLAQKSAPLVHKGPNKPQKPNSIMGPLKPLSELVSPSLSPVALAQVQGFGPQKVIGSGTYFRTPKTLSNMGPPPFSSTVPLGIL